MIISFVLLLALLIVVHELGHFLTAKAAGVKVEEFGLGFPPRLVALRIRGTIYSLNLLLLGGFVRLLGETDPQLPGSLSSKSIPIRLLVLSSGPLMNLLLPLALFSSSLMIPHQTVAAEVQVEEVSPNSPAHRAGIQPGDIILKINQRDIYNLGDLQYNIGLHLGREMNILLRKSDSSPEVVKLIPRWRPPTGEGVLGIRVKLVNPTTITRSYPFWEAIPLGIRQSGETLILFKNEVLSWFARGEAPKIVGPVGVAQLTGEVSRMGASPLLDFAAFLSLNLGLVNLLPLPALDGGRLVFVLLEWLRGGKRVPPQKERLVHLVGFAVLMAAIIIVTYYDLARIFQGESLMP